MLPGAALGRGASSLPSLPPCPPDVLRVCRWLRRPGRAPSTCPAPSRGASPPESGCSGASRPRRSSSGSGRSMTRGRGGSTWWRPRAPSSSSLAPSSTRCVCVRVCLSVRLPVRPSVCLSVCLCVWGGGGGGGGYETYEEHGSDALPSSFPPHPQTLVLSPYPTRIQGGGGMTADEL